MTGGCQCRPTDPACGCGAVWPDTPDALIARAEAAVTLCGPCDSGLPMACTCDPEPRAVIADLLARVAAERERAEQARDYGRYEGEQYAKGNCPHSGLSMKSCKASICDCFDDGRAVIDQLRDEVKWERERADAAEEARDAHFAARNALSEKTDRLEAQLATVRHTSRVLPCDGLCWEYPEEDCSLHGREPAELWEAIAEKNKHAEAATARADAVEAKIAAVEALADEWIAIGANEGLTATDDRVIHAWYRAGVQLRAELADTGGPT